MLILMRMLMSTLRFGIRVDFDIMRLMARCIGTGLDVGVDVDVGMDICGGTNIDAGYCDCSKY